MARRILISTGGSGGHVVPATILYEHLKDQYHVLISSDYRGIKFLDKHKYNLEIFNVSPISKNILSTQSSTVTRAMRHTPYIYFRDPIDRV